MNSDNSFDTTYFFDYDTLNVSLLIVMAVTVAIVVAVVAVVTVVAIKQGQIPAAKKPVSLMRDDNKRPDGTTFLPWVRGKPMAWDVTVPDT